MNGCVQRAAWNRWKDWFSLVCFVEDLPGYLTSWINEGERKKYLLPRQLGTVASTDGEKLGRLLKYNKLVRVLPEY